MLVKDCCCVPKMCQTRQVIQIKDCEKIVKNLFHYNSSILKDHGATIREVIGCHHVVDSWCQKNGWAFLLYIYKDVCRRLRKRHHQQTISFSLFIHYIKFGQCTIEFDPSTPFTGLYKFDIAGILHILNQVHLLWLNAGRLNALINFLLWWLFSAKRKYISWLMRLLGSRSPPGKKHLFETQVALRRVLFGSDIL